MDPVTSSISINLTLPFKGPLDCPICHRPQKTLSDLKTHGKRTHQLEKILSPTCCLLCNRNFPSFKQASCHFRHCNSKQDPRHPPTTIPTTSTSTDTDKSPPTVPPRGDKNDNGARNSLDGRTDSYPYTKPLPLDTLITPISTAAPKAEDHFSLPTLSPQPPELLSQTEPTQTIIERFLNSYDLASSSEDEEPILHLSPPPTTIAATPPCISQESPPAVIHQPSSTTFHTAVTETPSPTPISPQSPETPTSSKGSLTSPPVPPSIESDDTPTPSLPTLMSLHPLPPRPRCQSQPQRPRLAHPTTPFPSTLAPQLAYIHHQLQQGSQPPPYPPPLMPQTQGETTDQSCLTTDPAVRHPTAAPRSMQRRPTAADYFDHYGPLQPPPPPIPARSQCRRTSPHNPTFQKFSDQATTEEHSANLSEPPSPLASNSPPRNTFHPPEPPPPLDQPQPTDIPDNPDPDADDTTEFVTTWVSKLSSTLTFLEFSNTCRDFADAVLNEGKKLTAKNITRNRRPHRVNPDRPTRRPTNPPRRRQLFNPLEARRLQTLYRLSKKRAARQILRDNTINYSGSTEAATKYFTNSFREKQLDLDELQKSLLEFVPTTTEDPTLLSPLSTLDIRQRLLSMANSAPGKDRVEYRHLKLADPNTKILQIIYNRCLEERRIPQPWKDATTILIHKKGPSDDPSNFRPIALMSCIYKLFTSLLATRVSTTAINNNLMSDQQKSARPSEGCHEHTHTLQTVVADCKRNGKNCFIAWLDLRNAFGSIPHQAIYATLSHMGFPIPFISLLQDIYTNANTVVRTSRTEETPPIPIKAGVKQGCPISAILFNLTSELLLRAILHKAQEQSDLPFSLYNKHISVLAYADDLVLLSRTRAGLQAFLDAVSQAADTLTLTFRSDKCSSLALTCNRREPHRVADTIFTVQNAEIPPLTREESYRYLGIPIGLLYHPTEMTNITDQLIEDLRKINDSLLAPWQKLDAIRTFIQPCLTYVLRACPVTKDSLTKYRSTLLRTLRSIYNLPKRATTNYFFAAKNAGGLGLQDPFDERHIQTLVHALKMLSSTDSIVSAITKGQLTSVIQRCVRHPPTELETTQFLSGSLEGPLADYQRSSNSQTLWSRARIAARRLKISFLTPTSNPQLTHDNGNTTCNGKSVASYLHQLCQSRHAQALMAKPDQGKVARCQQQDKFATSTSWCYDGLGIRFADWRFIHKARTNTTPTNANKHRWSNTNPECRRCRGNSHAETLPHILCHCPPNMVPIRSRHDRIVTRLSNAIYRGEISRDVAVPDAPGRDRPDLVIRDGQRVIIIDIACPFENDQDALDVAATRKVEKYQYIADHLKLQGLDAKVFPFIIGALGSWYPGNGNLLNELRISKRYRNLFRKLCCADAIQGSRNIYIEHLTNHRQ